MVYSQLRSLEGEMGRGWPVDILSQVGGVSPGVPVRIKVSIVTNNGVHTSRYLRENFKCFPLQWFEAMVMLIAVM